MTNSIELLSGFDKNIASKKEELAKIQKQIKSANSRLLNKIKKHFIDSKETLNLEALKTHFDTVSIKKLAIHIVNNRLLTNEEITPDNLFYFERFDEKEMKSAYEGIKRSFEALNIAEQYKMALFCGGYIAMHKKFDFIHDFLFQKIGIKEYGEESQIRINTYNYKVHQSIITIAMYKDDFKGAKLIANALKPLIENGYYEVDMIDICKRTCNSSDSYSIKLEKQGEDINPVFSSHYSNDFSSIKDTFLERLVECIEYVAKCHPNSGVEELHDDEW